MRTRLRDRRGEVVRVRRGRGALLVLLALGREGREGTQYICEVWLRVGHFRL